VKNGFPLSPEHPRLAQILDRQGYATAAFVSSYVLDKRFGLAEGFDTYDDDLTPKTQDRSAPKCKLSKLERCADDTAARAAAWLRKRPSAQPFFLFVHLFDPHAAYRPPPGFIDRFPQPPEPTANPEAKKDPAARLAKLAGTFKRMGLAYDGEIAFADEAIGQILDTLEAKGLAKNTLVVITADHGEALGEHKVLTHGATLYDEVLHVPLVFRWPARIAAGREIDEPVGLIDVTPTILALAGVDTSSYDFQGTSLAGSLTGTEQLDPERPVYFQRRHFETKAILGYPVKGNAFGLRRGQWKYTESEARGNELYDLRTDPKESKNLVDQMPEKAQELAAELERWKQATRRSSADTTSRTVSPEDNERLRALGYVE
jgi:arylsulfatase A-like enzyme